MGVGEFEKQSFPADDEVLVDAAVRGAPAPNAFAVEGELDAGGLAAEDQVAADVDAPGFAGADADVVFDEDISFDGRRLGVADLEVDAHALADADVVPDDGAFARAAVEPQTPLDVVVAHEVAFDE